MSLGCYIVPPKFLIKCGLNCLQSWSNVVRLCDCAFHFHLLVLFSIPVPFFANRSISISFLKIQILFYLFLNYPDLFSLYCHFFQLAISKKAMGDSSNIYEIEGTECLGSCLHIQPSCDTAPDLSKCFIQWYRIGSEGGKKELISGTL